MNFKYKLWMICGYLVDSTIEAVINILDVAGSLSCYLGGASFGLSYAMDKTLTASYYGSASIPGVVNYHVSVLGMGNLFNQTIPFYDYKQTSGQFNYNLIDYTHPTTVRVVSAVFFTSGILLSAMSVTLGVWQQGRKDTYNFKNNFDIILQKPTLKEYVYANSQSICHSISKTMFSNAISVGVLLYAENQYATISKTYPSQSSQMINATDYYGPVATTTVPFNYATEKNSTINFPLYQLQLPIEEKIDAMANATLAYGGGVFFKTNKKLHYPLAPPIILGVSAHVIGTFFSRKKFHHYDNRVNQAYAKNNSIKLVDYSNFDI